MQPVLYSVREALEGRPHWVRSGSEICYYRLFAFCLSSSHLTLHYCTLKKKYEIYSLLNILLVQRLIVLLTSTEIISALGEVQNVLSTP